MAETLAPCPSCEGYGWFEDELDGIVADCDWCQGCGYVYRDAKGVDRAITPAEYSRVAAELERLEAERLRQLGYTGKAKRPGKGPANAALLLRQTQPRQTVHNRHRLHADRDHAPHQVGVAVVVGEARQVLRNSTSCSRAWRRICTTKLWRRKCQNKGDAAAW